MADFPLTGAGLYAVVRTAGTPTSQPAGQVVPVSGSDTNSVANDGNTRLRLVGTGGTTGSIIVAGGRDGDGNASVGRTFILTATLDAVVGPFPVGIYGSSLSISQTGTVTGAKLTAIQG